MALLTAGQPLAGKFRLIRRVGRGGMGEVWLAEDLAGERRVAIKFLAPAGQADAATWAGAEFQQARKLAHPGIVRFFDFDAGPPPFLVMQYVEGGDAGALRGAGFADIVAALIPVAEALEYAHRQGVVHRDLKPANILRDATGRCVIADFGIGALPGGGSLPAMSPQQLDGQPAATSDDIYGFGTLLYELLAGQPIFHPDVTPERIRGETPVLPATDLTGVPLPEALHRLLAGLLQKSPGRRPPGMAAVRASLEEILRDRAGPAGAAAGDVILPRARQPNVGAAAAAAAGTAPPAVLRSSRAGLPAPVVYGAAGVLALAALAVIFYLPAVVRDRGPLLQVAPVAAPVRDTPAAVGPAAPAPAAAPVPQAAIDEIMGQFMRDDDELRRINAEKWGGADWAQLRRLAEAGDQAYRARDPGAALASYRGASELARNLLTSAPEVLANALRAGAAAIAAGDQAQAIRQFETALAVAPDNAEARRGLERARKLDKVVALVSQGSAAEATGQRSEALQLYRQAAALDPAWPAAVSGVSRLSQAAARDAYETQMARGFTAQAGANPGAARAAFESALRARPEDPTARAALAQIDADEKLARLGALQAEARALESREHWAEAVKRYESLLALDANLQDARPGLERTRARADLDERLRREPGNADRYNDDAVLRKAQSLLDSARAVAGPGPVLQQQIAELERLLRVAMTPVRVSFESDNLTEVTVFKVGRLGIFTNRTLDLRPGAYTVVGSRPGYRDVRRNFRVGSGGEPTQVIVRCEEPI